MLSTMRQRGHPGVVVEAQSSPAVQRSCLVPFFKKKNIYLQQVSIMNAENKERCLLEVLKEDIQEVYTNVAFWPNSLLSWL